MRSLYSAGALALHLTFSAGAQAQVADSWRSRVGQIVKDTVLANGLTVIVAENHVVPLTTVKVSFRGGAAMQGRGEEGLAHLAEHYLFRAYGDEGAFSSEVSNLNGTYNGTTSEEEVNYFMTIPSKELLNGVRIMAKLVREPKLNDKTLSAEKKIVTDELARYKSDGNSALHTELGMQLWSDAWHRKNVGGSEKAVNAIKIDRIRTMLATQYVPTNAAVIITGDVNAAVAIAEAVRRFGDWTAPAAVKPSMDMPLPAGVKTFAVSAPDIRLVTIAVQWAGPSVTTSPADAIAGEVFAEMLSSALSPAVRRLVSEGALHSLSSDAETLNGRGVFTLTGVTSPEAIERALPTIRDELDRFAGSDFLNDSLLIAAKKALLVRAEYHLESGITMADMIGSMWSTANTDYFRAYGDVIEKVTLPMVESFVKQYLLGRPYVAGVLAPQSELARARLAIATSLGAKGS